MQSLIQTPTPQLEQSQAFYQQLGFQILDLDGSCFAVDGHTNIEINEDRHARAGIKLYKSSWQETVDLLTSNTEVLTIENGYLLAAPCGTWIYLMEGELPAINVSDFSSSVLGNYAGISLEVIDMAKAQAFWQTLGFVKSMGDLDQGWLSLQNEEGFTISLMKALSCPHLFFNPSLTYFNGKENNPKVIQKLRDLHIPITEEITVFNKEGLVDNVIIRDPGGLGFFLFND